MIYTVSGLQSINGAAIMTYEGKSRYKIFSFLQFPLKKKFSKFCSNRFADYNIT